MKRIILSLSLLLTVAITTTFANGGNPISDQVLKSFKKEFATAQLVQWNDLGEYLKASFVLGDHRVEAYFNTEGELLGSVRGLFYNQLPLAVMTSLDKRFAEADILDVNEITNAGGTSYLVNLEFHDKKYRVKADPGGNLGEIEKVRVDKSERR